MIGTIEALGVFLLAIIPGFLGLRAYEHGRPPLRLRGALGELGASVGFSAVGWTLLYLWRGQDLLPIVLGDPARTTGERLDAFAELAGLSILIGLMTGLGCRVASSVIQSALRRRLQGPENAGVQRASRRVRDLPRRARRRIAHEMRVRSLPAQAWDRLLTRLVNRREAVLCRITTKTGGVVLGVLARNGYLDWEADGRGVLFDREVTRDEAGQLRPIPASQGVYVPGDEIAVMSVIQLPAGALTSSEDA